jgi:hypothetical protein
MAAEPGSCRPLFKSNAQNTLPESEKGAASSSNDRSVRNQTKKQERALRQSELKIGEAFRPNGLWSEFGQMPMQMIRSALLSDGEKLLWMYIAKVLGTADRQAYPGYEKIAADLGKEKRAVIRLAKGLEEKGFLEIIPRKTEAGGSTSNEYRLLWHTLFLEPSQGVTNRHSPPVTQSVLPGGDKSTPKKEHHHRKRKHTEKKKATRTLLREFGRPAESPTKMQTNPDDDDHRAPRRPLNDAQGEFRARLKERVWLNGPIVEPDGIVLMVRDALQNKPLKWKRFLDYEDSLTAPEEIKNPGGFYRTLLNDFLAAEENTRVEQQRASREEWGGWQSPHGWNCPDGRGCKFRIIEDENGAQVCSCARTLPQEERKKLHSQVAAIVIANRCACFLMKTSDTPLPALMWLDAHGQRVDFQQLARVSAVKRISDPAVQRSFLRRYPGVGARNLAHARQRLGSALYWKGNTLWMKVRRLTLHANDLPTAGCTACRLSQRP